MPDYSYPQWLIQRHAPWEALVAGVQAGSQIAANRQRGRALAAQLDHQAFQETVLQQKAEADAQDLRTLQEWWPTFANAEGEALQKLQVPPFKNVQMWNRLNLALGEKRQQAAASELANGAATLNLTDPADVATWYELGGKAMKSGLKMDIKDLQTPVFKAQELKRLENSAKSLADYRNRGTVVEQNLNRATELEEQADNIEVAFPEEAEQLRLNARQLRESVPVHTFSTPEGPVRGYAVQLPDGTIDPNHYGTIGSNGRFTIHPMGEKTPSASLSLKDRQLRDKIVRLEKELDDLPSGKAATADDVKQAGTLRTQINDLQSQRDALTAPKPTATTPAKAESPEGMVRMVNPQGATVLVPRSRLGEATSNGYRMAQ